MGTVSRWAINSRRGPRIVPGNFTIRLPQSPPSGLRLGAVSSTMAEAGMPKLLSFARTAV